MTGFSRFARKPAAEPSNNNNGTAAPVADATTTPTPNESSTVAEDPSLTATAWTGGFDDDADAFGLPDNGSGGFLFDDGGDDALLMGNGWNNNGDDDKQLPADKDKPSDTAAPSTGISFFARTKDRPKPADATVSNTTANNIVSTPKPTSTPKPGSTASMAPRVSFGGDTSRKEPHSLRPPAPIVTRPGPLRSTNTTNTPTATTHRTPVAPTQTRATMTTSLVPAPAVTPGTVHKHTVPPTMTTVTNVTTPMEMSTVSDTDPGVDTTTSAASDNHGVTKESFDRLHETFVVDMRDLQDLDASFSTQLLDLNVHLVTAHTALLRVQSHVYHLTDDLGQTCGDADAIIREYQASM